MPLSGRYRWYLAEVTVLATMAGIALVASAVCVVGLGILGGLHAILVDRTWWPYVSAGWGLGAVAAFVGTWLIRRILRTIRCFEYDADIVRFECVGSQRTYTYRRSDVRKIIRYQERGGTEWRIVFGDKKWARLCHEVENAPQLVDALIGDSPRSSLAKELLNGVIFERRPDAAPLASVLAENAPTPPGAA